MTTVRTPKRPGYAGVRVHGILRCAVLVCLTTAAAAAAEDGTSDGRLTGALPPGAIGSQRLVGVGPLSFCVQPVEVLAPRGTRIAFADGGAFGPPASAPQLAGLQPHYVYRLRVTHVPGHPGVEVFPTIQVIDRLHPPPGEELRFPIPVELTREELLLAAQGAFVKRVIYVENPDTAVPIADEPGRQNWFEAAAGQDPFEVAKCLGRPVAILRIGGRAPDVAAATDQDAFAFGAPPVQLYERAGETVRRNVDE